MLSGPGTQRVSQARRRDFILDAATPRRTPQGSDSVRYIFFNGPSDQCTEDGLEYVMGDRSEGCSVVPVTDSGGVDRCSLGGGGEK